MKEEGVFLEVFDVDWRCCLTMEVVNVEKQIQKKKEEASMGGRKLSTDRSCR